MPITSVSYQKTYSIGPYLTDKVGFEMTLDEGQAPDFALSELAKLADEWHKKEHPNLYKEEPIHFSPPIGAKPVTDQVADGMLDFVIASKTTNLQQSDKEPDLPVWQPSVETPKSIAVTIEEAIRFCTTTEELAKVKEKHGIPANIKPIYVAKLKSLQNLKTIK